MRNYRVAIVGFGPRGLSLLERLAAVYRELAPSWTLAIDLVDPGEPGQGAHPADQPDHLLANTVSGQVTMFTDDSVRHAGPIEPGPSLMDWARAAGYRRFGSGFKQAQHGGEVVEENDYLPRSLLGRYFSYVYDRLIEALPPNVVVTYHRCLANDVHRQPGGRYEVVLDNGVRLDANHVVIVTGHGDNDLTEADESLLNRTRALQDTHPRLQFIPRVKPFSVLQSIPKDATVGIQGIGLTAYDIIADLTIGRGGEFHADADRRLRYRPSGKEPRLVVFSRQGIPFCARATNEKGVGGLYKPRFFTRPWIDSIREERYRETGSEQLDFDRDLWPVLVKEMCFAYRLSETGESDAVGYEPLPRHRAIIDKLLFPFKGKVFDNDESFARAVKQHVEEDVAHAKDGNVSDPVKAATDVLRDVRDYLRYAVDYGGLTECSHRVFLGEAVPNMYRLSAGAPKERNMELLALLEAGLLSFGPGPNAQLDFDEKQACFVLRSTRLVQPASRTFDVLVRARTDCAVELSGQTSPFLRNLLAGGIVRPFMNGAFSPGGLDVDSAQNVVDAQGRVQKRVWALGIPAEGPNFCTYVLPRVQVNSRFLQFSGRCAVSIVADIDAQDAALNARTHRPEDASIAVEQHDG